MTARTRRSSFSESATSGRSSILDGCTVETCDHPHYRSGHCRGHYEALRRGRPLRQLRYYGEPLTRLLESCYALADASESDDDLEPEIDRVRKAAKAYCRHLGWRPAT